MQVECLMRACAPVGSCLQTEPQCLAKIAMPCAAVAVSADVGRASLVSELVMQPIYILHELLHVSDALPQT